MQRSCPRHSRVAVIAFIGQASLFPLPPPELHHLCSSPIIEGSVAHMLEQRRLPAKGGADVVSHLQHRALPHAADVIHLPNQPTVQDGVVGRSHVSNVQVRAYGLARPVHGEGPVAGRQEDEFGDCGRDGVKD